MDTSIPLTFVDATGVPNPNPTAVLSGEGEPSKPIVILLHGKGGTKTHMESPEISPGLNFDNTTAFPFRNLGNFTTSAAGPWGPPSLDPMKTVTSWRKVLNDNGFRTVTYSQIDPSGPLARPVLELAALIQALDALPGIGHPRLVLLAHSRGGLLARKFIKDNRGNAALVRSISKVITLHSPHLGSELANDASALTSILTGAAGAPPAALPAPVATALAASTVSLAAFVSSPANPKMQVGGSFLTGLAAGESALPGVKYFTFGGTSVRFSRVVTWVYTPESALPRFPPLPPFNHTIHMVKDRPWSPIFNHSETVYPENSPGKGDFLVADSRARLPFATHRSNQLNHAEALWDARLQSQVLNILNDVKERQQSKAPPALAVFNNQLRVAFIADNPSDDLLICSSSDGQSWSTDTRVQGQSSKAAPALAVLNNQLFVAFIANNPSNDLLVCSSSDGVHWSNNTHVQGQSSKAGPALAVLNGQLFVTFIANNPSNDLLVCSSSDGVHWSNNTLV